MSDGVAVSRCADTTLAVLAGGEGRRMGMPKGQLILDGLPILERLLDRLGWPGPTLLVTAPGREHPPGWRRFTNEATDDVSGEGPLRGILTALENALTDEVIIIPVDMPNITLAPLVWLAARLQDHPAAAAVMVEHSGCPRGGVEPLPAAFRSSTAKTLIRARLGNKQLALHRLAERSEVVLVSAAPDWPADFWLNLNTPAELAALTLPPIEGPQTIGTSSDTLDR
jgi:molybdopterin-guanine dinucleotide biosynthesis protein A